MNLIICSRIKILQLLPLLHKVQTLIQGKWDSLWSEPRPKSLPLLIRLSHHSLVILHYRNFPDCAMLFQPSCFLTCWLLCQDFPPSSVPTPKTLPQWLPHDLFIVILSRALSRRFRNSFLYFVLCVPPSWVFFHIIYHVCYYTCCLS